MLTILGKAVRPAPDKHWNYVYRLDLKYEKDWLKAFAAGLRVLREATDEEALAAAVRTGNPDGFTPGLPWRQSERTMQDGWSLTSGSIFTRAGKAELMRLGLGLKFNLDNPLALDWVKRHGARLVREVSERTRQGIVGAIMDGYRLGKAPAETARRIRGMVGLLERDMRAVANRWEALTAEGLRTERQVEDMIDVYMRRLIRRRALNIARTETVASAAGGTQESWRQAREAGFIGPEALQEWIAAPESGRTCEWCMELNGQQVPLGSPFESSYFGTLSGPPAHPSCRCALGLA